MRQCRGIPGMDTRILGVMDGEATYGAVVIHGYANDASRVLSDMADAFELVDLSRDRVVYLRQTGSSEIVPNGVRVVDFKSGDGYLSREEGRRLGETLNSIAIQIGTYKVGAPTVGTFEAYAPATK
jgi:hypothetical protein